MGNSLQASENRTGILWGFFDMAYMELIINLDFFGDFSAIDGELRLISGDISGLVKLEL